METKDILRLDLVNALDTVKRLSLTPHSAISLPILQAQLSEHYGLRDYFVYGKDQKINNAYYILVNSYVTNYYENDVALLSGTDYKNILKYLHPNYYSDATKILLYERKIIRTDIFVDAAKLPYAGYFLSAQEFSHFSAFTCSAFSFFRLAQKSNMVTSIPLVCMMENYDEDKLRTLATEVSQNLFKNLDILNYVRDLKDYLYIILRNIDEPMHIPQVSRRIVDNLEKNEVIRESFFEDLPSIKDFYKMISTKDPRLTYYIRRYNEILGIRGVSGINFARGWTFNDLPERIKQYIEKDGFRLSTRPSACKNKTDYYYEDYEDFVITYGNLLDGICYSVQDLTGSFVVNSPDDYNFRRPDRPDRTFTFREIERLYSILTQQNPNTIPNFRESIRPLIEKIKPVFSRPPSEFTDVKKLSPEDQEIFIEIMIDLFEAGMYQRTWKGPGHPFVYKKEETHGSTPEQIECAMNPSFARIIDGQEKLSENGRKLLKVIPAIAKFKPMEVSSFKLWEFLELTTIGEFCIGYGSGLMIETATAYLDALGTYVNDFDYSQFNSESTHRADYW